MTKAAPNVLLLLDLPTERKQFSEWLQAETSWQGTVFEHSYADFWTIHSSPLENIPVSFKAADIVVLDEKIYHSGWTQIQAFWQSFNVTFLVLLENADEALAKAVLASGVHEYLVKPHLNQTRLRQTLTTLWRQNQLQQALQICQRQDVFGQAAVGINQADQTGRYVRVNQQFCDLLGYSEAELLQMTYQQVTHPDDLAFQTDQECKLFNGEFDSVTLEKRYIAKNGQIIWTRVTLSTLNNEHDRPISDLAIVEDVSDRKQTEADLSTQKKLLRAFLDNLPHIAWLKDCEGRFITANAAFGESCGLAPDELVGKTDLDIWPADLAHTYRADDFAVMASGQLKRVEEPLVASDGSSLWIDTIKTPVYDDGGDLLGTVGIATDVTARKHLEQELRDSRALLSDVLSSSKACITSFRLFADCSWQYDYYSPGSATIYGYAPEVLQADPELWRSRVLPEDFENVVRPAVEAVINGQDTNSIEFRFRHADGSIRWISESCSARWDEVQQCWVMTTVGVDISDRKRLETQLRDSEAELRGLFEAMDDVVLVLDRHGTYLKVAPSGAEHLYVATSELIGRSLQDFFSAEQAHAFLDHIHQVLETRQTQEIEYSLEIEGVERWFSAKCSPIAEDQVIFVARDISDRKRSEAERRRYAAALAESEAKFRSLIENASEITYTRQIDGTLTYVSPQVQTILGYAPQDLIKQNIWQFLVHPNDVAAARDAVQRLLTSGQPQREFEVRLRHQDGHWHWVRSNISGMVDDEGTLVGIQGMVADIHNQRLAEQALHESRARFEAIYTQAAVGICLASIQSGGLILANEWFCDFLGYAESELLQMSYRDYSHPDDQRLDDALMAQLNAGEIPSFTLEKRFIHRSGEVRWANLTVSLVKGPDGQPLYDIAIVQDIRERKQLEIDRQQAETALQENRDFLQTILDNLPISLFVKDARPETFGQFVLVNQACEHYFGQPKSQILGQTDHDLFPADEADEFAERDRDVVTHRAKQRFEENIDRPHVGYRVLDTIKVPICDVNGQPKYLLGISQDVTAYKQAQTDLRNSEAKLLEAQRLAHLGSWEYDLTTGQIVWSQELLRQYGFDESIQGPTFDEFVACIHPEDWPELSIAIQQTIEQGIPYALNHRVVRPDGTERQTFCKGQAVFNEQNQVVKLFGVSQDITEMKAAELALQASERKQGALISALPDLIIRMSGDGIYLDMFAASNMVVLDGESLVGCSVYERGLPYDLADQRLGYIQQALATGELQIYEQTLFNGESEVVEEVRIIPSGDDEVLIIVRDISDRKQAEIALRQSERRLQTLIDALPFGVWARDAEDRLVLQNTVDRERYGDHVGTKPSEMTNLDDYAPVYLDSKARCQLGEVVHYARQEQVNGEEHFFHRIVGPFPELDGEIGMFGVHIDVTEQKQAEIALQKSERRYATLTENSPIGIFRFNAHGQLVYVNPRWCEMTGQTLATASGEDWINLLHSADRDRLLSGWAEAFAQQRPYRNEGRHIHTNGSIVWFDLQMVPEFDETGRLQGYIGTVSDISDRKQAEFALRDSERRYAILAENSPVGVFQTDPAGNCVYANPMWCQIAGLTLKDVLGPHWAQALHPADREATVATWYAAVQAQSHFALECRFQQPSSQVRWIYAQGTPLTNGENQFVGYIGTITDITDRKLAEMAIAQEALRRKTLFDTSVDGIVILDMDGCVVEANASFAAMLGYPLEEVTGLTLLDFDVNWSQEALEQKIADADFCLQTFETLHRRKDGTVIDVEISTNQVDWDGNLVSLCICRDVSDRKAAAAALQASETAARELANKLSLIYTHAPSYIYELNRDGTILFVNRLYEGVTEEQVLGTNLVDWFPPDLQPEVRVLIEQSFSTQTPRSLDCDVPDIHGQVRSYSMQIAPIPLGDECNRAVLIGTDISDRKAAEAALQASEERLRTALQAAQLGSWDWNLETNEIIWSESLEELMGLESGSFDGRLETVTAMTHPEDRQRVANAIARSIAQDVPYDIEFRFIKADGSIRWAASKGSVVRDANGRAIRMAGMDLDITNRKQAELALQESERRYATLAEMSPNAIFRFDAEGRCLYVNPRWCKMTGRTVEQGYGDDWVQVLHPEDRDRLMTDLQAAIAEKKYFRNEGRHLLPDGSITWFDGQIVPELDDAGELLGFVGTLVDITERKQAEIALQASEARFKQLAEASPGIIFTLVIEADGNLYFEYLSPAFEGLHEIPIEAAYQDAAVVFQQMHPDDRPGYEQKVRESITALQTFQDECRFMTPSGVKWLQISSKPTRREDEVIVFYGVVLEITERKQAELALQELNEQLEDRVRQRTQELARSEQDLRTIFNNVYDAIFIHDLDGTILDVNDRALEISQATHEQLLGASILDVSDPAMSLEDASERVRQVQAGETLCFEWKNRRFDNNSTFDTEVTLRQVHLNNRPVLLAGVRDISDRKQAETDLQESRNMLELVLNAIPQRVFWKDRNSQYLGGNLAFANDYQITPTDIIGKVDTDFYRIERATLYREEDQHVLSDPNLRLHYEEQLTTSSGKQLWLQTSKVPLTSSQGEVVGILGCYEDITERKRAEAALRDSEERLRLALNASKQGLYDLNLRTGQAIVSANYASMLGYNPVTFHETNAKWLQRLHPDDQERVRNTFRAYVAGDIPEYKVEFRQRMKNGQWKWILSVGKIVTRDETGTPLRMLGTHTDIDERKRAEEAMQASEARFRQIAENIKEVFWLATPQHEILYVSPAYEQVWGRSREAVDAATFLSTVYPEDRDYLRQRSDLTYTHYPQDLLNGEAEIEYRIVRPDGAVRWIRDRAFPVFDEQGAVVRIAGVAEDITDRKLLERDQARLLSILEASPDHIGMMTSDGQVIWNNHQAKLLRGLPLDSDVTQLPLGIYHPQWALQVIQQWGIPTAMQQGIWIGETALLNEYEQEIPVSQLILAHRSATGEVEYLSTIIRDISPLKQAEQALRKINSELETRVVERTAELVEAKDAAEAANRAKSVFLANMSHELRTPLNAILGFSQLMGRDRTLSSKHLEELKIINRSGEHLLTLINDILEMSKIEAGQVTLSPSNFELLSLLNGLVDMLRLKAETKGLRFTVSCHPQLPRYIRTDSHKLRQVLLNLLSNAIKFTQTGYVALRVEPGQPLQLESTQAILNEAQGTNVLALRFEVEDSGIGIAEDEIGLLFEPFVQTASGRKSQEGTGLGLPISRQFVTLLGGSLEATSEVGIGSTFAFEIPVQAVNAEAVVPSEVPQRAIAIAPGQPTYRILVVEDNWANRVLLQNLLTDLGFEVQTAVDGQAAIAAWQSWQPQLVFMDIRMPELNGCDATQEIRRLEQGTSSATSETRPTKIISLTAGVFESNQPDWATVGFDDFVCKPIQEATITQIIAQHLGVRFTYVTDTAYQGAIAAGESVLLTEETLQSLSIEWIQRFQMAITQLNQDKMLALIAELPPAQDEIAQLLRQKVQDFDYELLLNLIQAILKG